MNKRQALFLMSMVIIVLLPVVSLAIVYFTPEAVELWQGRVEIVKRYLWKGHEIIHAQAELDYSPNLGELVELIQWAVERQELEPDHGLYIVIQSGHDYCLGVIGLTYDSAQVWTGDLAVCDFLFYNGAPRLLGISLIWPADRMEERIIIINYAWLLGLMNHKTHPWFPELAFGRPLPLDSKFMWP